MYEINCFLEADLTINQFYNLDPTCILKAVESLSIPCTGRFLQLNSLENRVYEIELEPIASNPIKERFIVAKFYRPERWSKEQIEAEHSFLLELDHEDIPVVPPLIINKQTLFTCPTTGIYFTLYPKFSGRNPDEFSEQELPIIARLIARIHQVGARNRAACRKTLDLNQIILESYEYLTSQDVIPKNYQQSIKQNIDGILQLANQFTQNLTIHRIHGDAHRGNLIKRNEAFYWLDFDDFANGPAVQDMWLLFPGRDEYARKQQELLVHHFQEFRDFKRADLFLIEPLRVLRVLHFSVWIHRRWQDPYFQKTFENFATERYWQEQLSFFAEELNIFQMILNAGDPLLVIA